MPPFFYLLNDSPKGFQNQQKAKENSKIYTVFPVNLAVFFVLYFLLCEINANDTQGAPSLTVICGKKTASEQLKETVSITVADMPDRFIIPVF